MEGKALAEEVVRPEAENRVLGRLDFALRHLLSAPRPLVEAPSHAQAPAEPVACPQRPSLVPDRKRAALALALGHAHFGAGALEAAEHEFRDAVALEPGSADAYCSLVVTLTNLGRLDEAERELRAAEQAGVRLSPSVRDEIRNRRAAGSS